MIKGGTINFVLPIKPNSLLHNQKHTRTTICTISKCRNSIIVYEKLTKLLIILIIKNNTHTHTYTMMVRVLLNIDYQAIPLLTTWWGRLSPED